MHPRLKQIIQVNKKQIKHSMHQHTWALYFFSHLNRWPPHRTPFTRKHTHHIKLGSDYITPQKFIVPSLQISRRTMHNDRQNQFGAGVMLQALQNKFVIRVVNWMNGERYCCKYLATKSSKLRVYTHKMSSFWTEYSHITKNRPNFIIVKQQANFKLSIISSQLAFPVTNKDPECTALSQHHPSAHSTTN